MDKISIFSLAALAFFSIGVGLALVVTLVRIPLIRRYRPTIVALIGSAFLLSIGSYALPKFVAFWNPEDSRMVSLEDFPKTEWVPESQDEQKSEPTTKINVDGAPGFEHWGKITHPSLEKIFGVYGRVIYGWEEGGSFVGRDAYTDGHVLFRIKLGTLIQAELRDSKAMVAFESKLRTYVGEIDLTSPSVVWLRVFPKIKSAQFFWDPTDQWVAVASGAAGAWNFQSKTGEMLWHRADLDAFSVFGGHETWIIGRNTQETLTSLIELRVADGQSEKKIALPTSAVPFKWLSGLNCSRAILASSAVSGTEDEKYIGFDAFNGSIQWTVSKPRSSNSDPMKFSLPLENDQVLMVSETGGMESRHCDTGELVWQKRFSGFSGEWVSHLTFPTLGQLYAMPEEGGSVALFSLDGEWRTSIRFGDRVRSIVSLGNWWFVASQSTLVGLSFQFPIPPAAVTTTDGETAQ